MTDLAASQRDSIKQISPPWLSQGYGEKYLYNFGFLSDVLLEKMNQAMRAHMPLYCDSSALPFIGLDRSIPQGPREADAAYRIRLQTSFDAWQRAGSRRSILQQALGYMSGLQGSTASTVPLGAIVSSTGGGVWATWDTYFNKSDTTQPPAHISISSANWNWDGNHSWWWAYLVLYFQSGSTIGAGPTFGTAGVTFGQQTISIGTNTPASTWQVLRSLVSLWKSANTYFPWFVLDFSGNTGVAGQAFSPNSSQGSGNPDGTWGSWAKTVNGVAVAARSSSSRYVDGTGQWVPSIASIPISA